MTMFRTRLLQLTRTFVLRALFFAAGLPLLLLAAGPSTPEGGSEADFSKTDLYKRIQGNLVDPDGRQVKSDQLAKSRFILLYYSASW